VKAALRVLVWAVVLALAAVVPVRAGDGQVGVASWYGPGTGVAMPFCTWTLRHTAGCGSVRIQSHDTGLVVTAPVVDWCQCYVGTPDERLVDLQWGVVDALGLDREAGLYDVTLWVVAAGRSLVPAPQLPDTAAR
jgi:hypothetical protein